MKRSNRLVILVGVLLAVLAFVLVVIILNSGDGPGGTGQTPPTVKVVVATADIAVGDPVGPELGQTLDVDPSAVVGTPFSDPSQLSGSPALVPIPAGAQISKEMIQGQVVGGPGIEPQLLAGEKAVAFQVDRVTGLDFLIQPGDHIDIVLTEQVQVLQPTLETADLPPNQQRFETIPGLENARTVKTILQDRRVLYVSATRVRPIATGTTASPTPGQTQAQQQAQQQLENVIIVFAGNDQDAEVIKFAQNNIGELGSLTAILRRTEDTDEEVRNERTTGITIDILFEEYGIPVPNIINNLGPRGGRQR